MRLLLPRATVITPNLPEAACWPDAGGRASDPRSSRARAARARPGDVVVTGGHRDEATDLFFDGDDFAPIPGPRHPDGAAHGSGCTHSSALAAHLAHGFDAAEAARAASAWPRAAVRHGLRGSARGAGPVDALGLTEGRAGGLPAASGPLA